MKTSSLELLEKNHLPAAQARAILQVMESELAIRDSRLATKADLQAAKSDLCDAFHALEVKLEAWRGEVRTDTQTLRTEMQTQRAELIGEIKGTISWNFAFWVTQLAAIAAILKLLK